MKALITLASLLLAPAITQGAETPVYPTVGVYSPMKTYDKVAAWTLPNRPRGYLVTIGAAIRFDPAISDYITCELPGMSGAAGNEKVRFSVGFSETKTVTIMGYVPSASVQLNCISEGSKLKPIALDAAMTAISIDNRVVPRAKPNDFNDF